MPSEPLHEATLSEPSPAQQLLYTRLHEALEAIRNGDTDMAEDCVLDVLDQVTGWCSPRLKVFPDARFEGPSK